MSLILSVPAYANDILIQPGANTIWAAETSQDITWHPRPAIGQSGGKNYIKLEYSRDSGYNWILIANFLDPSTGKYSWFVPGSTSHAQIRLTYLEYPKANISLRPSEEVEYSGEFDIIRPTTLTPPTDLIAKAVSSSQIDLAWKDNTNGETAYSIERKAGDGSYSVVASVPADTTAYSDKELAPGYTYSYRVKAVGSGDNVNNSDYSDAASATTKSGASQPDKKDQPGPSAPIVMKYYIGNASYYVGDQQRTMDAVPMVVNGRTMLPVKFVADPLGASVGWNESEKRVTIKMGSRTIELWIDNKTARVDGASMQIDPYDPSVNPVISSGRTMLPLRFIAEQLGCKVDWNQSQQEITISYPKN